jgi:hypothetical protein
MSSPTKLSTIVTQNSTLRQLIRQASVNKDLEKRFKAYLDEPFRRHIQVAALRTGSLILNVDSSAWAAKMRYLVPDLLSLLNADATFPSIQTIRVKVAVSDRSQSAPETKRANPISGSSAVSLQHCADQVNYPALKDALLRLKRRESSEH